MLVFLTFLGVRERAHNYAVNPGITRPLHVPGNSQVILKARINVRLKISLFSGVTSLFETVINRVDIFCQEDLAF